MNISISEFKEIGKMAAEGINNPGWNRAKAICPECGETIRFKASVPFGKTCLYECLCHHCSKRFTVSVHSKVCI